METYIPISYLNDFLFCPRSIYFHQLYEGFDKRFYDGVPQIKGKASHRTIDSQSYSSRSSILQGITVYSQKYRLGGKIDIFDQSKGLLVERKRQVKLVHDGYVFQIYGQYHCLTEMGYEVKAMQIRSLVDNKRYPVPLPKDNCERQEAFEKLIDDIQAFSLSNPFEPIKSRCQRCNYSNLCDYSLKDES